MKKRNKKRGFIRTVLLGLVVIGLAALVVGLIRGDKTEVDDDDGYTTPKLAWELGNIDETGAYVESETAIYSSAFNLNGGMKIEKEFDSTVNVTVHFYSEIGEYISSCNSNELELPEGAFSARLVVTGQADAEGNLPEIKFYNKASYYRQITVKVLAEEVVPAE